MLIQCRNFTFISLFSASFVSNSRPCSSLCHCFLPFTPLSGRELCIPNCHTFPWAPAKMWMHMIRISSEQDDARALGGSECFCQPLCSFPLNDYHNILLVRKEPSVQPKEGGHSPAFRREEYPKMWGQCLKTTSLPTHCGRHTFIRHAFLFKLSYHTF